MNSYNEYPYEYDPNVDALTQPLPVFGGDPNALGTSYDNTSTTRGILEDFGPQGSQPSSDSVHAQPQPSRPSTFAERPVAQPNKPSDDPYAHDAQKDVNWHDLGNPAIIPSSQGKVRGAHNVPVEGTHPNHPYDPTPSWLRPKQPQDPNDAAYVPTFWWFPHT